MEMSETSHDYAKKTKLIAIIGALLLDSWAHSSCIVFTCFLKVEVLVMKALDLAHLCLATSPAK